MPETAAPERKSNFFLGFLLLPREKREALSAIYAYCRLIDDVVDDGRPKEDARRALDFWRAELGRLYAGAPTHELSRALLRPVEDYRLPREALEEMIRGCAMDLEGTRYETLADLESYMRGVAGSVGLMCVHVFGWRATPEERIRAFARDFGYAFQLTNIVRDVGADLELGRVYLPAEDMRAAGYDEDRLRRRVHDEAFERLMRAQYDRAKAYYARARAVVDPADRRSLAPAEVMAHVYEGLLDQIAAGDFRVLHGKPKLSKPRKLALAFKGLLSAYV